MEAQLLLMQHLSSHLQARSGGQVDGSESDEEQWQDIMLLWKEVQPACFDCWHVLHLYWSLGHCRLSEPQLS